MKKSHLLIPVFLMQAAAGFAQSQRGHQSDLQDSLHIPKIDIIYLRNGTPFDQAYSAALGKSLKKEDKEEIFNRLDEFQQLWERDGNLYFRTILTETHVRFPYLEMQATLTLSDIFSISSPLLINVTRFLQNAERPLPAWAFPEMLFHEIMHTYARDVYTISALRKKYENELPVTLNHLHSMAIEKFVLEKLKKTEILTWLDDRYRNKFGDDYKRAWEIVNDIEGHQAFIDELKNMGRK